MQDNTRLIVDVKEIHYKRYEVNKEEFESLVNEHGINNIVVIKEVENKN